MLALALRFVMPFFLRPTSTSEVITPVTPLLEPVSSFYFTLLKFRGVALHEKANDQTKKTENRTEDLNNQDLDETATC